MNTNYREAILNCPKKLSEAEIYLAGRMNKEQEKNLKTLFEIKEQNPKLIFGMDQQHHPYLWNYYTTVKDNIPMIPPSASPMPNWEDTRIFVISEFGSSEILFSNNFNRDKNGHVVVTKMPNKQQFIEQMVDECKNNFESRSGDFTTQNGEFVKGIKSPHAAYSRNISALSDVMSRTIARIDENHYVYRNEFFRVAQDVSPQKTSVL